MAATQQVLKVDDVTSEGRNVHYEVIRDFGKKYNQYTIKLIYWENHGWHKKIVERYDDMKSCLFYLASMTD